MKSITLKVDLYDYAQVEKTCKLAAEKLGIDAGDLHADLDRLTLELERYMHEARAKKASPVLAKAPTLTNAQTTAFLEFLKAPKLMDRIGELIGRCGIVGEQQNRLLLFVVASSYKMPEPLHALIQGSSGSGKTRLLDVIARCMPTEDVKRFTRVTDNAFYNQAEDYFTHKLVCLEDLDGLKEDAQLAVRELQSRGVLTSSTSVKDERGAIHGGERTVRGPIASLACTTRGEVYEDNVSRSLVVAVDESSAQTQRVIGYQNARAAGKSTDIFAGAEEQENNRQLLANCVRMLRPYKVVNPYADRVKLPESAHKIRRLNELYLCFVRQVCLLNQYQRKKDKRGRIVAQPEDLRAACEILFEAIVLKVDELDGSLRQFYERLKVYAEQHDQPEFTQRDVRQAMHLSKAQCSRFFAKLQTAEYITSKYSGNLRKVCYRIDYRDDYDKLRRSIKQDLEAQIDAICA